MKNIVIVDKEDNVVGCSPVALAVEQGLIRQTVSVMLFNREGKVFLQQRSIEQKLFPGFWEKSCSGHIDEGEVPEEAAQRELQEELGISGLPLFLLWKGYVEEWEPLRNIPLKAFDHVFLGFYDGEMHFDRREVSGGKWIDPEEVSGLNITPGAIQALAVCPSGEKMVAIDIVLLPPQEIIDLCITLNQQATPLGPLGKEDHIPHLSLAIAGAVGKNIPKIVSIIREVAQTMKPLPLRILRIEPPSGERSSDYLLFQPSPALQRLHELIMDKISPYVQFEGVSKEWFYVNSGEIINKLPRTMVDNFQKTYAYDKYQPHITLRCTGAEKLPLPIKQFTASTIALFHVGESVTCRKMFWRGNVG